MKLISTVSKLLTATLLCAVFAHAQTATQQANGVLQAPPEIANIVSIDGHNTVLIESQNQGAPEEPKQYALFVPRHIYSGAIARLFGGSIISTEALVIPESARRAPGGLSGGAPGGVSGIGGNGSNNNNFNSANDNNSNSFNRGFPTYSPHIPVNDINQLNRVLGLLDRPIRQAQIGISQ